MTTQVLHLVGSPTDEFFAELSGLYAAGCLDVIADDDRWTSTVALVSPDASWRFTPDLSADALERAAPVPLAAAIARLVESPPDVVVPQMFCVPGMTTYRSLFDLLGVRLVGNTATTMALAADKSLARAAVAAAGVRVPDGEVVERGGWPTTELPAVVKPVDSDNSHGVGLVTRPDQLDAALEAAWACSPRALVERYVEAGREVRCATVELDGELVCLPLEEYDVDPRRRPIRDAADKLRRDADGRMGLVAKDDEHAWIVDVADPITPSVHEAARRCHRALGCRQYGLFDFRIDPDGHPWFLEAGPYCSFSRTSVVVTMAAAAGIAPVELFASMVDAAVARPGVGTPR
ncbi:D-alanine--D-alanine ligase family protein [Ilumatobacter sp.]|uniref:D-alanine--D-alanine ligase family protein n=1 Tax=Ilumatobacter sp. TaxID=1967498 RepID=UPI003B51B747